MKNWGRRPWSVEFRAQKRDLPGRADIAVVGGGFTGLAAAAWVKRRAPKKSVVVLEADEFGAGSSGHTGGVALAESAVGDLPGLGDVLSGYQRILKDLDVDGDILLPGAYELGRTTPISSSPIRWKDSGELCVVKEVPGGTIHPGKIVSGLARAAERAGALLFQGDGVEEAGFAKEIELRTRFAAVRAGKVLFATNAFALELTGLLQHAKSTFTIAVMTEELSNSTLQAIALADGKPFYTVDLPYLWGRLLGNAVIFGSGLLELESWRELTSLDIGCGKAVEIFGRLEKRIRNLHPALHNVQFTHRWGGPICITEDWKPVFARHPESENAIVLGGYSGHGVAQSVYLGAWAAEVLLGERALPEW
jgi:glycine/D-amino acid oxidase-like deaminating enzyme